jgi:hypothetical protein
MPATRRTTKAEQARKLERYWRARHREYPTAFAAGVVYGLRCAREPGKHLDNIGRTGR